MPDVRSAFTGPWRGVLVLGVTQILAWGALFYPPVLTVPLIAAERGWSAAFTMGGLSCALLTSGLLAPTLGGLIDRHGGHRVMPVGSLAGALGLVGLATVTSPAAYLATWVLIGAAMAMSLYTPAFATLTRIFGAGARRPITVLTLAGGLASTVSWPMTHVLIGTVGWRSTYLIYAAALIVVAAPLHAFALPRMRAVVEPPAEGAKQLTGRFVPATGLIFVLIAAAFASYGFVPSGMGAHMLAMFTRLGLDAGTVVLIGTLFGPSQVTARLCEFVFGRDTHPLRVARFAVGLIVAAFALLAIAGISVPVAIAFAIMLGVGNGLMTIANGTLPLALFGPFGYGRLLGRIVGPALVIQSAAPLTLAFVAERVSDPAALALVAAFAAVALVCFLVIRRPA